jgi:hypothetical protein
MPKDPISLSRLMTLARRVRRVSLSLARTRTEKCHQTGSSLSFSILVRNSFASSTYFRFFGSTVESANAIGVLKSCCL